MMNGSVPPRAEGYPARFVASREAYEKHGRALDRLGPSLLRADPLADDVVAAFAEMGVGAGFAMLERALAAGIDAVPDAPPALRALFAQIDEVPSWVDWDALDRGGAVLLRAGAAAGLVLGLKSLVLGYASPGGNKPLVFSGRLQQQAGRRLGETSRFVHAVSRRGGVRRSADGFAITVKVRVMHAQVRRLVRQSGRWRSDLWGEPINQHDMVATALLFSIAMLDGLETLGYRVPPEDAADVVQLWRYVGYLIGVEEQLLPRSFAEAWELADAIRASQGAPDEDARALVRALLEFRINIAQSDAERRTAARRAQVVYGLARLLLGDELADQLAIPRTVWRYLAPAVRPAATLAARAHKLPVVRELAEFLGDHHWTTTVNLGLGGKPATFAPPAHVAGAPPA